MLLPKFHSVRGNQGGRGDVLIMKKTTKRKKMISVEKTRMETKPTIHVITNKAVKMMNTRQISKKMMGVLRNRLTKREGSRRRKELLTIVIVAQVMTNKRRKEEKRKKIEE